MTARRFLAAIATAAALVSCGIAPEGGPTELSFETGDPMVFTPSSTEVAAADAATAASVYLVRNDQLVHLTREVGPDPAPADVVAALLAGPSTPEARAGLTTAIPSSAVLVELTVTGDHARVDLSSDFAAVGGLEEILAIGQIVMTLTAEGSVVRVTFALDGIDTAVPTSAGALTDEAVRAADYVDLVSP